MTELIINSNGKNVYATLQGLASKADTINIAVAFFSETSLIKQWNEDGKKINLIVSFRPPTNYYALKDINALVSIQLFYLGNEFHSKIWIFYKNQKPFAALLGSSNFSNGGLKNNTEANLLVEDETILLTLHKHFTVDLKKAANKLEPTDLDAYKEVYDRFMKNKAATDKDLADFSNKTKVYKRKTTVKVCKTARQYFDFWRVVNEVKDIVKDLSDKHFPNEPYYLVLDHFWHWVKTVWHKESNKVIKHGHQTVIIPKLFKQYVKWQNSDKNADYPKWMLNQSKNVFKKYLSQENIDSLTKEQALEIYRSLHSSDMPMKRFGSDYTFDKWNNITKIRKSFKYLLYSNDGMDVRIHNLLKNPEYKLSKLASSGVQEINGWTFPEILPIRNDKADRALEILGYRFKDSE